MSRTPPPKKRSGTFRRERALPQSLAELDAMFPDDAACRQHLAALRWRGAVVCPWCGAPAEGALSSRGLLRCVACHMVSSPVTSTLFDASPVPLRLWFRGLWEIASREGGADPDRLARVIGLDGIGVWAWLDAVRALYRVGWRDRLHGVVEIARVPIEVPRSVSGPRHDRGPRPRSAPADRPGLARAAIARPGTERVERPGTERVVLAVAVEARGDAGRCRVERLERVDAAAMSGFVSRAVSPGSTLRTGTWNGYAPLRRLGYGHLPSVLGHDGELERAQQLASLARLWLWGNGHVTLARLPYYLDELVFRYDARLRHAASDRGALWAALLRAALHEPAAADLRTA